MDHPILLMLVKVTIFTIMLKIGLTESLQELISLWRRPGQLIRALIAVVVLVPIAVAALLWALDLPRAVATGLAVLAAAPGAPLTTKRSQMASASLPFATSVQLTLALMAVVTTPITLGIFYSLFDLETEHIAPLEVARQVAMVQFLPLTIGVLLKRFAPKLVDVIGKPVNMLANVLFLVLVAVALIPGFRMILHLGGASIAAIVIMVGVSLAIGHSLGGPVQNERSALAVACIARNIGLALFIVALSHVEQQIIPTLLAYMILGAIVAIPYSLWSKRQVAGPN